MGGRRGQEGGLDRSGRGLEHHSESGQDTTEQRLPHVRCRLVRRHYVAASTVQGLS